MNEYENKIELMNYLNVLWKRKWFIIFFVLISIGISAAISFILPPKWKVDAIYMPSKYTITERGRDTEKYFFSPKSIANFANLGGYNNTIASKLRLDDIGELQKLKAENPTNTDMVRFFITGKNVERAKLILDTLLDDVKNRHNRRAENDREELDSQIKSKELEKSILENEINLSKKKLDIINQRKQEIENEMSKMRKRIRELEKERRLILNKKDISELESLAIMLHSNEIQNSSMNLNMLNELYEKKSIEEENINLEIKKTEIQQLKIDKEINDLNERKKNIYDAQIIKEPTPSASPVSPKKLFNILIAAPLGFIIFTMIAYFLEYLEKYKARGKAEKKI